MPSSDDDSDTVVGFQINADGTSTAIHAYHCKCKGGSFDCSVLAAGGDRGDEELTGLPADLRAAIEFENKNRTFTFNPTKAEREEAAKK